MKRTTRILAVLSALLVAVAALFALSGSAQAYPPPIAPSVNAPTGDLVPGGSGQLTGQDWKPGDGVNGEGASTPFSIGTSIADAQGKVHYTFTFPADITPGTHHFTLSDPATGESATVAFEISSSAVDATSSSAAVGSTGSGGSGPLAFTGVEIAGIVLAGLVLIAGGTMLVLAGRRRRNSAHAA